VRRPQISLIHTHVGAHHGGLFKGDELQSSVASNPFRFDGHVAERRLALGDLDLEIERGFQVGLVEAREGPARVTRLELSTQHVVEVAFLRCVGGRLPHGLILGPIETCHNIVHGSREVD